MLHHLSGVRALVVALAITVLGAAPLRAGILNVPGDSATIQGAIVLAADGDTIPVAPGTYVETINLLGKRLVVESTGGADVTIIDGNGGGSTVSVQSGEPAGTAIRGFTITGGTGQDVVLPLGFQGQLVTFHGGGGVHLGGASHLELADCVLAGNSTLIPAATPKSYGGGLYVSGGTLNMHGCTLSGNSAKRGAGMASFGNSISLTVAGCTITGNTATEGAAYYSDFAPGTLTDCAITDNSGNGIDLIGYQTHFVRCVVRGNTGWGLSSYGPVGSDVIGLAFLGNGAGGAYCPFSEIQGNASDIIERCIFANGDGVDVTENHFADFANCSFDGAVIDSDGGTNLTLKNSIVRGGTTIGRYASLAVTYSDVEGGMAGTGNIDADPLWVDASGTDYRLLPASPCIDAGSPSSPLDPDGTRADMGAVPFENAFDDLGGGVAGSAGPVVLAAHGTLIGGEGVVFTLSGTTPFKHTLMILGASSLGAPFKGGTMWPALNSVISGLVTNGTGQLTLSTTWPASIPSGFSLWAQFWMPDAGAVYGFAGSNGVRGTVP